VLRAPHGAGAGLATPVPRGAGPVLTTQAPHGVGAGTSP